MFKQGLQISYLSLNVLTDFSLAVGSENDNS